LRREEIRLMVWLYVEVALVVAVFAARVVLRRSPQ